jgi:hypothetical protein
MGTAERDGELIANLLSEPAGLGKAQMMRIAGLPAADGARLFDDEAQSQRSKRPRAIAETWRRLESGSGISRVLDASTSSPGERYAGFNDHVIRSRPESKHRWPQTKIVEAEGWKARSRSVRRGFGGLRVKLRAFSKGCSRWELRPG